MGFGVSGLELRAWKGLGSGVWVQGLWLTGKPGRARREWTAASGKFTVPRQTLGVVARGSGFKGCLGFKVRKELISFNELF